MPVGVLKIPVDYQTQRELLDLYVVKNKHPSFLGKDWLSTIRLAWCSIKLLQASLVTLSPGERLNVMLNKYSDIFEKKLGIFTSANAKLTLKDGSQGRFLKAKLMPYAFKPKVEEELRRRKIFSLEWSGVNGPHSSQPWSPQVARERGNSFERASPMQCS